MKKLIISLFAVLVMTMTAFGYTDYGISTANSDDNLYVVDWYVTGLDSSTANATVTSSGFDARPFIAWFLQGNLTAYTARDTTINNYIHSNLMYSQITINGTGTADSLNYVYLQGLAVDGAWYTFDTLNTAKAVPCQTVINLAVQNYYLDWRIKINVADLTVSMYAGVLHCRLIVPKIKK